MTEILAKDAKFDVFYTKPGKLPGITYKRHPGEKGYHEVLTNFNWAPLTGAERRILEALNAGEILFYRYRRAKRAGDRLTYNLCTLERGEGLQEAKNPPDKKAKNRGRGHLRRMCLGDPD